MHLQRTNVERYVLQPGAHLTAVRELPAEVRSGFWHHEDDIALTSPRLPSQILSAQAASLVEAFRSPATIAEAVSDFAIANSLDPQEAIGECGPFLEGLIDCGFLICAMPDALGRQRAVSVGDLLAGYRVVDEIRLVEDAEVFLVRREGRPFILQIPRNNTAADGAFARQAAILSHLDGRIAPRLIADAIEGRPALVLEWCEGVDAKTYAAESREDGRNAILALCQEIAATYARLHEAGIVHGSVHPRNIIVGRTGGVRLIDFGLSFRPEIDSPAPPRARVPFYFDPDQARALADGRVPPPASFRSEQYSVASLLYSLATGHDYLDFSGDRDHALQRLIGDSPLPFADLGVQPWPELETILRRALSKSSSSRFESMRAFSDSLAAVAETTGAKPPRIRSDATDAFVREAGNGVPAGGRSSVAFGSAGIAYALYRLSRLRDDPRLLALARAWIDHTSNESPTFSAVSPYHAPSGIALVRALMARAGGDETQVSSAAEDFESSAFVEETKLDLYTGRSGVLLGAAMLLDVTSSSPDSHSRIFEAGESLARRIVSELEGEAAIASTTPSPNLGIAHGWAGYLYAIMRWCRSANVPLPAMVAGRLHELQELAIDRGRGLCWRWQGHGRTDTSPVAGWCNGSAGFVHLWTLALELLGDPRFAELAEGAAWHAWEGEGADVDLCCGLAGRAHALLELGRHSGEKSWMDRAKRLAARALGPILPPGRLRFSLYGGIAGIALLQPEIESGSACMPMFGDEGSRR